MPGQANGRKAGGLLSLLLPALFNLLMGLGNVTLAPGDLPDGFVESRLIFFHSYTFALHDSLLSVSMLVGYAAFL